MFIILPASEPNKQCLPSIIDIKYVYIFDKNTRRVVMPRTWSGVRPGASGAVSGAFSELSDDPGQKSGASPGLVRDTS